MAEILLTIGDNLKSWSTSRALTRLPGAVVQDCSLCSGWPAVELAEIVKFCGGKLRC